jgi:hypothetical protein
MYGTWMQAAMVGAAALLAAGCEDTRPKAASPPAKASAGSDDSGPTGLVGVEPSTFQCDSIIATAALGELLGGTATQGEAAMPPPPGTPAQCVYQVTRQDGSASVSSAWSFDFDCRQGMRARAMPLFEQYRRDSIALASVTDEERAQANKVPVMESQGGKPAPKPAKPAPPTKPAADPMAVDVEVGERGLDHQGQGLMFIDDDALCYVRVGGPDAAGRLALAKAISAALHPTNAPMSPRAPDDLR